MKPFVLITPEHDRADEPAVLAELFALGLERCHVRKPHASAADLRAWIEAVPAPWRSRLVLHQHHELVAEFGLGGLHWRDVPAGRASARPLEAGLRWRTGARPTMSRSCHDVAALRAALGQYDAVLFSPVFASISKPGYGPTRSDVTDLLSQRTPAERRTVIIALGGIDADTAPRALALGFDGVAVLGAVWQAVDPVGAFRNITAQLHAGSAAAIS